MPNPTVSAAGGAMLAEGHKSETSSEADRDPSRELLCVVDDINEVRYIIEATWMAVESIEEEEDKQSIQTLLSVAKRQLTAARDRLDVARGAQPKDRANV
jgi:hypothetical protein